MSAIKIIPKVWGQEEVLANDDFCFKRLVVKQGWQVSYHHHRLKDELFYLESGRIKITIDSKVLIMSPQDWVRVKPGVWHSFAGLEDSVILEASTHDDPADSYRDKTMLSGRMTNGA